MGYAEKTAEEQSRRLPPRRAASERRLYTASELMHFARVSRSQASYWEKAGLVVPLRRTEAPTGKPARFYSATDLLKAAIISDLKQRGLSLGQVQTVVRNLEEHGLRLEDVEPYLLTDGYSVYYARTDHDAIDILRHHRQMLLLVPMKDHAASLQLLAA
jgi:DNA-binding transcriptional MerR regulator